MTGALINVGTVLAGGTIGLALKSRLPARAQQVALRVLGVVTIVLGVKLTTGTRNIPVLVTALALGMAAGALLRIQRGLEAAAGAVQRRFVTANESSRLAEGFITASLLFCVGPMTILGSIQDGISGDYRLIAVKAMMDGVAAMAFASTLGWGVLLSAGTVLVVQGGLTLGAHSLAGVLTEPLAVECGAAGGVLVVCIGIGLIGWKKLPVADYLPAIVIAPVLTRFFAA